MSRTVEVTLKLVFEVDELRTHRLPELHTQIEQQLDNSDFIKRLWQLKSVSSVVDAYVTNVVEHNTIYTAP